MALTDVGRVVVVGSVNVDLVVAAPRLPGPGETVVGAGLHVFGGGKGANAAVAAARAGADVALVGAVGADDTGTTALAALVADGVDTAGVAVLTDQPTGVALIVVDAKGENQIAIGPGANGAVSVAHVEAALAVVLPGAACVLVSTEIPLDAVAAAVRAALAGGVRCVLNPAPVIEGLADLVPLGAVLTPNESELAELGRALGLAGAAGAAEPAELLAALVERSGAPAIVTLGGSGCLFATPGVAPQAMPARQVDVVDTTGAGDTFNGVLAARLAAGDDLPSAVAVAGIAASLSVGAVGAREGMPDKAAIEGARARP